MTKEYRGAIVSDEAKKVTVVSGFGRIYVEVINKEDGEESTFYITPEMARKMASVLLKTADALEESRK